MNIENYTNELYKILNEELKDLWKIEDQDFLKEVADDIAKQHLKLKLASSDKEKEICLTNIEHLKAQIQGKIASKRNHLIDAGDKILNKAINIAIKVGSALILG